MEWLIAYLVLGAFVGFFAGLFGIGGGLVLVPVLSWMFEAQQFSAQNNVHLALGTAMAAIFFSAAYSARTHHAYGAVNLSVVTAMTPGLLIGTGMATFFASRVAPVYLTLFFALFVYFAAAQMLFDLKPTPKRRLPGGWMMALVGAGIGAISSLVSIGGGTLSIPFLLRHNVSLPHAIGTSAALGLPIAVGGSIGYIVTGMWLDNLPRYSLGFVYLPAVVLLAAGSMLTTPLGAKATHHLPIKILRRCFAGLLLVLATRMLLKAVY